MTSSLRTVFRLNPRTGHWTRSPLASLNLNRHPPPPPPPRFETLASETTPVPSIQAPVNEAEVKGDAIGGSAVPVAPPAPSLGGPDLAALPQRVLGVQVPKKPAPPAEGECCMSGCATCVYDLYLDDLEYFHAEARRARTEILDKLRRHRGQDQDRLDRITTVLAEWPQAELGPAPTESDLSTSSSTSISPGQSAGTEEDDNPAVVAEREAAAARREISDPTLRAFLEMEARLKKQQQRVTTKAT